MDTLSICDLRVFRGVTEGGFVEFGKGASGKVWDKSSIYVVHQVYRLLLGCIERSVDKVFYYGYTTIGKDGLNNLQSELRDSVEELEVSADVASFRLALIEAAGQEFRLRQSLDSEFSNWESDWETVRLAVIRVFREILAYVGDCLQEGEQLHILDV